MPGRVIVPLAAIDPAAAEEASLFLIVGGLFMLLTVLILVLVRSLFPSKGAPKGDRRVGPASRFMRPMAEADARAPTPGRVAVDAAGIARGRSAAEKAPKPSSIEDALDRLAASNWGDGRILGQRAGRVRLRVLGCGECARAEGSAAGCGFHVGYLGGSMERLTGRPHRVVEVACARLGSPACEFEAVPT